MTKKRYLLLIALPLIALTFWLFKKDMTTSYSSSDSIPRIGGRKIAGLTKGQEAEEIKKIKVSNRISSEWQSQLKRSLMLQGGSALKDIILKVEDSFIWVHDGLALNVESVHVTVKNQKNEQTTFRVLVDSQNGKILQNWDRPTIDALNPHENVGLVPDHD
ncbi:MAG: hypothetical protein AB7I27_09155 [Bacteriovoracaceae bacterium]